MASENLIKIALRLAKQLGANEQKFLGTRSNVSFLGSGPQDGMLFQKNINPEMISVIGQEKIIPAIESSMSYATGGKLNDLQMNKLIDNMTVMTETFNPTNILKADFGLDSLRAKSGIGERQATEIASGERPLNLSGELTSIADEPGKAGLSYAIKNPADDVSVSGGQFLDKFSEIKNRASAPLETGSATAIMETIPKVDLPGKRAASREFLVNSLKVGDDYPSTTLSDVMSAEDMKFIMEGGGGVMGDPIVLVQKYFGPRIAEMVPTGGTAEEISIFTKRVMNNVEDSKGLRPDEQGFDALTARFMEELADGGRAGFRNGGFSILGSKNMTDAVIKRIEALMDEGLDWNSAYAQVKKEAPALKDGGRAGYAKGGLAKILEL